MTVFEKKIKKASRINNLQTHTFTSLTPNQKLTLNELKKSTEIIIMPTDKNLGPAILNRDKYIKQVLTEHLLTPSYLKMTSNLATPQNSHTKQLLITNFQTYKHTLSQPELDFFTRSFKDQHPTPIFNGLLKVHKTPVQLRPVVSCVNSFPSIFSTWLDFRMKELLHLIPSYIKNSSNLNKELQNINLPENAKLFTVDASSMYTNIDTTTGFEAFRQLFSLYTNLIPVDFPKDFFLQTLEIVMSNNILTFGDTFWLQLQGTAMGTPAAPLYSIITYGYYENTHILNTYQDNLIYYKRYIDDIFGIWIDYTSWEEYKKNFKSIWASPMECQKTNHIHHIFRSLD